MTQRSGGARKEVAFFRPAERSSHNLTVWNGEFFKRTHSPILPEALHDLLKRVDEKFPSPHLALYGLERGHLSLLISCDATNTLRYCERVPYLKLQGLFAQEVLFDQQPIAQSFFATPPPPHLVVFPIKLKDEVKGALVIVRHEGRPPSKRTINSLSSCLLNIATRISSLELHGREQLRSTRLGVINKMIQNLDVLIEEKQLYDRIVNLIRRFFKYDHVAIYTLDNEAGVLVLKAMAGKFGKIIPSNQTIPLGQGIVSWVVNHDKSLLSNNVHKNPFFLNWTPDLITTEAELCVPIHVDKRVIGVLNIEHSESLYFDEDDTNSIELLADRIGVAIKNSRLYSELIRSHAQLQEIVSSMGQGLMIVDRDLRVEWINGTIQEWGFDLNDGSFVGLFGANSERLKNELVQRTLTDGTINRELLKGRDGRYFRVISAPVLDGAGLRMRVLIIVEDVTTAMRSQEELERMKQELEMAQRLNVLGELAASIAHEIRNPLNAMLQASDLLEGESTLDVAQRRLLAVFKEESKSLNDILSSYLMKAKPPEPQFAIWDLRVILEQVVSLLQADRSLADRVAFTLDIPESVSPISLDASSIKQLFLNLFLNAIDAIKGRGEIRVQIREMDDRILLHIHDNGCGIPKSLLPNIFKPFFTTKDKGTGLGLAVVKRIVDEHGWDVEVESEESVGTTFRLTIPLGSERD